LIFSSLLQVYKKYHIRLGAASNEVTGNIVEENTITARLFKKRNIDHDDELQIYLSLPTLDGKTEPLQWWKMNEMQFPGLASMARDYLTIPATSVLSEESFSMGKNTTISWATHTFNLWWGCTFVEGSPACAPAAGEDGAIG